MHKSKQFKYDVCSHNVEDSPSLEESKKDLSSHDGIFDELINDGSCCCNYPDSPSHDKAMTCSLNLHIDRVLNLKMSSKS